MKTITEHTPAPAPAVLDDPHLARVVQCQLTATGAVLDRLYVWRGTQYASAHRTVHGQRIGAIYQVHRGTVVPYYYTPSTEHPAMEAQ